MPRSINDIIPPSRRRAMEEAGGEQPSYVPPPQAPSSYTPPEPPHMDSTPPPMHMDLPRRRFPWKLAVSALVVVVVAVGAIYAFSGASVEVTPVVSSITVSGDFAATPSAGDLPFEVISVEKIGMQTVPAEGTENANDPAQGAITIYNGQEKVQELIKNTRFETSDGLVFRIHDSIKVPAGTKENPGTLKVTAYADAGGDKYNIGPSTFTLPGLKGSAVFELVYAKSEGSMSGGFSGVRPSVSQKTRDAQSSGIQAKLQADITEEIAGKIPEGYVLVPGATFISYMTLPDAAAADKKVNVEQKGLASAYVFPKNALAKAIAYKTIGTYAGQPVTLDDANGITLSPAGGEAPAVGVESFGFSLAGNANVVWVVDATKIAGSVAGKSRNAAQTILAGFPEIEKAVLTLKPFWAGSFPEDPANIKVTVKEAKAK